MSVTAIRNNVQRYYASSYGRFNTADPMRTNIHLGNPGSWNSYAYGNGDPVGNNDPSGQYVDSDSGGTSYCSQFPGDPECAICQDVPDSPGCIGDGDGSDPSEPAAPAPPSPPPCAQGYQNWINAHGADAASVAKSSGTTEAEILGISALESGWGTGPFVGNGQNAFFNLEVVATATNPNPGLLPFSTGWSIPSRAPNVRVATYSSYLTSAQSFAAVEGSLINGVTNATAFATILQQQAKFGIGPNGPVASFIPDLTSIINKLTKCLQ